MPLVTVVMPVYNAEELLAGCLDSLVAQSFEDFELICIDDGSTDGSAAILADYAHRYPFIRVVTQANRGQYPTRNVAFRHVRGKYLMSVDCDDRVHSQLVERAFYRAEAQSADITLIGWDYLDGTYQGPDVRRWYLDDWQRYASSRRFPMGYGYVWMKMYRMGFIDRHGLRFREDFYCKADVIFHWVSMSLAERIAVVPEPLYHYRVHGQSVTGTIGRRYVQVVQVMEAIRHELEACGDPKGLLSAWYPFALDFIRTAHAQIAEAHRGEMEEAIQGFMTRLTEAEKRVYREPGILGRELRYFYLSLESPIRRLRYGWLHRMRLRLSRSLRQWLMPDSIRRRLVSLLRSRSYTLQRSAVPELRRSVDELNETLHELAAENYELRQALNGSARERASTHASQRD